MAYRRFRVCFVIFPTWLKGLVIPLESLWDYEGGCCSKVVQDVKFLLGDRQTGGVMEERFCSKMTVHESYNRSEQLAQKSCGVLRHCIDAKDI